MVAPAVSVDRRKEGRYLPENHAFATDKGCFIHPSCSACPLPKCISELPPEIRRLAVRLADGKSAAWLIKTALPPEKR